jgi:hypothetical protein
LPLEAKPEGWNALPPIWFPPQPLPKMFPPPPQPPYSRIRFETVRGSTVTVWQEGRNLYVTDSVSSPEPRVVTPYLRYLAFTYVGTMDDSVMSVNLCLEKESFRKKRIFYVTNDRVRILNE